VVKIDVFDKIATEKQKRENMVIKEIFLHKSPSKRCFKNGIHSLLKLMPEEVLTSYTVCDGYLYFASQEL